MRTDEIRMGAAAVEALSAPAAGERDGALSGAEAALVPHDTRWFEDQECWLYFHLTSARDARLRIERMNAHSEFTEYQLEQATRRRALERARKTLEALRSEKCWRPDGLLAAMMLSEGA